MYYDYALAAPVMAGLSNREAGSVLVLGNGTGTFAHQCTTYFPNLQVEGVEIDDRITDLAYAYFDMSDEVQVTTYDGRAYLQAVDSTYDVIQVDAYQDITIPFQMSSTEFFTLVREHLNPGGVMVVNLNMHSDGEGSINQALCDTIASVFPYVCTVDVPGTTNRELFAAVDGDPIQWLKANRADITDGERLPPNGPVDAEPDGLHPRGPLFSPTTRPGGKLLGMGAIGPAIIQAPAGGTIKEIFREEGLSGLLSRF